jgi:NSS family neurotransmitter:Na+ symporter
MTVLHQAEFVCSSILIPLGGLFAVILVGWVWGFTNAFVQLKQGCDSLPSWGKYYFWFCFKYSAPILIVLVFLNALGVF